MQEQSDAVFPFAFESLPVRGEIVQLQSAWRRMQLGHNYAAPVREVLGHAAAAAGLISQSLKFNGKITLQISGSERMPMLVMQCTSKLALRGMASAQPEADGASFAELTDGARCAITLDAGRAERRYQGIVEVCGDTLRDSLQNYYARSAQIPSHLQLVTDKAHCGGILLQQMPGGTGLVADDWRRLGLLAGTLRSEDLAGGVGPDLLQKLFAEDDIRLYRPRAARFHCQCSQRRAEQVLKLLGETESREVCAELGRVEVTCEYCGRTRSFDTVDLSRLFATRALQDSDALH